MIIMRRDGSMLLEELDLSVTDPGRVTAKLPASLVLHDSSVIDSFLAFAFEVLRFRDVSLRIYDDERASEALP